MPPADAGKPLSPRQIEILKKWISAGGEYSQHWAFIPPKRPALPAAKTASWPRNEIDRFVLARLNQEGLRPSKEADRYTLVRRVFLDLIGLPPTPEQADAFVEDQEPRAYEKLVDRLLGSRHYGERWARAWLDLARYSDTNGYEKDRPRSIWPYRDWVIHALNADMPYDQFTIEQLAGDMLPAATIQQRVATGFHRNTMLNEEGGIDPLEFRFYAMVDRVATTGTIWLGMTTGCAQCHTHKYDPITHTDFYRLMALLNNADEPEFRIPRADLMEQRKGLLARIQKLEELLLEKKSTESFNKWVATQKGSSNTWHILRPSDMRTNLPRLKLLEDGSIFSTGDITKRDLFTLRFPLSGIKRPITSLRLEVLADDRLPAGGPGRAYYEGRKGDFFLSEVTARVGKMPIRFVDASHDYGKIAIGSGNAKATNVFDGNGSSGWSTAQREGENHQLVLNLSKPLSPTSELEVTMLFERHFAASLGRFRWSVTTDAGKARAKEMPAAVETILARGSAAWSKDDRRKVERYYVRIAPELASARKPLDALRKQLPQLPVTLVMRERAPDNPRPTFRHHRGEYTKPKEAVTPGLPELFAATTKKPPSNRLEFARWLVSRENPLAARVAVNRAWRSIFGRGIVQTSGDFGTQSNPPSHPGLIDWLAVEFMDNGWSQKKLHRKIVTSATYRQSSKLSAELKKRDANNRLFARSPRLRVESEMVRDICLVASGLLSTKIGGPSVRPPQPQSATALSYGGGRWQASTGADRYRRSLYTFSKRTAPFAASAVFDAPSGENCTARRDRSNTPLQALTLLNDEMFLEMSRELGRQAAALPNADAKATVTYLFRRLLTRPPEAAEIAALVEFYQRQKKRLVKGELKAEQIAVIKKATPELAAWMMVARAIMNLDEVITKQ